MRAYPEVADFINKRADKFPSLEVAYVQGMRPQMSMRLNGKEKESFSITDWSQDGIAEYLADKLQAKKAKKTK